MPRRRVPNRTNRVYCPKAVSSPSFLAASLFVALGGGIGAWLRFIVGRIIGTSGFPVATLTVNVLGSFAMGVLASWIARNGQQSEALRLLLGVGVLGGFTTFSAFSLEIVTLAQRGALGSAVLYAVLSVAGGVIGLIAGLAITRATT
jgi:fluoride exporter